MTLLKSPYSVLSSHGHFEHHWGATCTYSPRVRVVCVAAWTWCRASCVALCRCQNWLLFRILRKLVRVACPNEFHVASKASRGPVGIVSLSYWWEESDALTFFYFGKDMLLCPQIIGPLEILPRWQAPEFLWKLPRTCMHLSYPEWLLLLASQEAWSIASSCYYQSNESGWFRIERQSRSLRTRFWYKAGELIHFQGKTVRFSIGLANWKKTAPDAPY